MLIKQEKLKRKQFTNQFSILHKTTQGHLHGIASIFLQITAGRLRASAGQSSENGISEEGDGESFCVLDLNWLGRREIVCVNLVFVD